MARKNNTNDVVPPSNEFGGEAVAGIGIHLDTETSKTNNKKLEHGLDEPTMDAIGAMESSQTPTSHQDAISSVDRPVPMTSNVTVLTEDIELPLAEDDSGKDDEDDPTGSFKRCVITPPNGFLWQETAVSSFWDCWRCSLTSICDECGRTPRGKRASSQPELTTTEATMKRIKRMKRC